MYWAMVLGGLLTAGFLQAEAPMDLDSPFLKVALVKAKTGEVERREIQQARLTEGSVEMEKMDGGMAVFPVQDVLAILPLPPKEGDLFDGRQVDQAIRILQEAAPELLRQAGLESTQIQDWEKIRDRLLKIEKKKTQEWLGQAANFRLPRTEKELKALREEGEALARSNSEFREAILDVLAALSQVQAKEKGEPLPNLSKLNEVQPRLLPDAFIGWLTGGIFVLSFFGLLFAFILISKSLSLIKQRAFLGGLSCGLMGLCLSGLLIWTWIPAPVDGQLILSRVDSKMEELAIYLKNRAKPVYYFPAKEFSFSAGEWKSGVLGILPVSDESVGLLRVKMKEGELRVTETGWSWLQPLTALGIPLSLPLTLQGKNPDFRDWQNPDLEKLYLGRWRLPEFLAGFLKDSASAIWQKGLSESGLAGIKLVQNGEGMVVITVPQAGNRPKPEEVKDVVSAYRRELSAEDLAKAFAGNQGKDFVGKFVVIDGLLEKISSGSEYSGALGASQGVSGLNKEKTPAKFGSETFDIFYLRAMDSYGTPPRPVLVKVIIKSAGTFVMDSYGDVYTRPNANSMKESPLIKKGYRVKFLQEGRVLSDRIMNNEIEVYGVEVGPDGQGLEIYNPLTRPAK